MIMKKILTMTLTILGFVVIVNAQSYDLSLRWTANPPAQMVTKYIVFQATGKNTNFIPVVTAVGTNFAKVRVNSPGLYQYKIWAVNGVTNSAMSEAVQVPKDAPSTPPQPEVISVDVR
jgi:hypothetical protein